jgi:two-component system, NarL family, invasion response regulator UvrY
MITVLVVDDHIIFREGIKKVLSIASDIEVVDETGNGSEALKLIHKNIYDVVLLDIGLPDMSGLDVLRSVKTYNKRPGILVLSIYPEELYGVTVLREGALGYLTKESVPSVLIEAIRKAARGRRYVSETLTDRLVAGVDGHRGGALHEMLSEKEFEVFRMLASGKSVKEIAVTLSAARTTVSTYRTRILEKMGMRTNADLTRYAIEFHFLDY